MAAVDEESVEKRQQFGNRFLTDSTNVFQHNAWDNVVWDEEQNKEAEEKVSNNSQTRVEEDLKERYEAEADQFWDKFYSIHQNRFFKDRHWLFTEFPELGKAFPEEEQNDAAAITSPDKTESVCESDFPGQTATTRIFEVGCGVGNTVMPILRTNNDPALFVYGGDLSETAINIIKDSAEYSDGRCHAFVCDVTDTDTPLPFPDDSLDVIILIFVLSAISPDKFQSTISRLARHLKPGGKILFRDYGRYDLAQLRFKDGKCISDNFYVRGDGTRVYFFTQDELNSLFTSVGLIEDQNIVDRRLQVNRGKQQKMYRVWLQCKYRKPDNTNV